MKDKIRKVLLTQIVLFLTLGGWSLSAGHVEAAPASAPPIKIGWIGPLTGVNAEDAARVLRGTKLAFEEVKWEIGGRKIELLVEDDAMNPAIALAKLKKFYYDQNIKILIGPLSSASGLAIRDFYHDNKILTVTYMNSIAILTGEKFSPYFFRPSFNASNQTAPFEGWLLQKQGYRTAVMFAPDFAGTRDQIAGNRKGFEKFGGKVLQEIYFPLGTTMDFAPYLSKIDMANTDVVHFQAFGSDAVRFVKQYAEYGYKKKIPLFTGWGVADNFLKAQGDAALGVMSAYWYAHTLDNAENRRFKKMYEGLYGKEIANTLTPYDCQGYEAGKVVRLGLEAVKGNDRDVDTMVKAIEKLEFDSPRGPIKFDSKHNVIFYDYLMRVDRVGNRLLNVVLKAYGPLKQGWLEEGVVPSEVPIPK